MRVLIFHGYLLSGTGSNVYNANLAAALRRAGHEVHLFSQERHPEQLDFVDAVGEWHDGRLTVRTLREPVRCTAYRPDIGGLLPVYVSDSYEGIEARPFPELSQAEIDRYLDANVEAVREVADLVAPDLALANHLVMGPAVLARALDRSVPYAAVIHGSALEYTVKPHPRFLPYAHEGIESARSVLVGSRHTAESLWAALGDPTLPAHTRLGPPGVDIETFQAREPDAAAAGLQRLVERLADPSQPGTDTFFQRDTVAAARSLGQLRPGQDRIVLFLGKEILSKGLDLLLAAWPLVLQRQPDAHLVVTGFGTWHTTAVRMTEALAKGDLAAVREIAEEGRGAEGGPPGPLRHLLAFLDGLEGEARQRFLDAAACMHERVVFTGRLVHEELADLLPVCEALVVPSTFPEAYGMVAAEAACCGTLPDQRRPLRPGRGQPHARSRRAARGGPLAALPARRRRGAAPRDVPDPLARSPRPAARTHPARARPVRPRTLLVGRGRRRDARGRRRQARRPPPGQRSHRRATRPPGVARGSPPGVRRSADEQRRPRGFRQTRFRHLARACQKHENAVRRIACAPLSESGDSRPRARDIRPLHVAIATSTARRASAAASGLSPAVRTTSVPS